MRIDSDKLKELMKEKNPDLYDRWYRSTPVRIQFTDTGVLIAECIVPQFMVEKVVADYQNLKHNRHAGGCGALSYRADAQRYFDVPVGSKVHGDN